MSHKAVFEAEFPVDARELYAWHARPGAVHRMLPPWAPIAILGRPETLAEGSTVEFRLGVGPVRRRWTARHEEVHPGAGFADRQVEGPFRSWIHRRDFSQSADGGCRLTETLDYELPLEPISSLLAGRWVERELRRTFAYRHATLASDLERLSRYGNQAPMRIAVTGAGGLVGETLVPLLTTAGHRVVRLIRNGRPGPDSARWDPERGVLEPERLNGIDAVIHLAGENIAGGRWNAARKAAIRGSRTDGTAALVDSLAALPAPPRAFLCASAIGYYGDTGDRAATESAPVGRGFLSDVCWEWEAAADLAESFVDRVVKLRFGVILTPRGGALAKMLPPFRVGAGGVVGSGRQHMSWISIDDCVGAILHCLATPAVEGPVNIVAPEACTNRELTGTLGRVLRRPTIAPLPSPLVKLIFGEMGDAMLLGSTRVVPAQLEATGFQFAQPELEGALRHLLGRAGVALDREPARRATHVGP